MPLKCPVGEGYDGRVRLDVVQENPSSSPALANPRVDIYHLTPDNVLDAVSSFSKLQSGEECILCLVRSTEPECTGMAARSPCQCCLPSCT